MPRHPRSVPLTALVAVLAAAFGCLVAAAPAAFAKGGTEQLVVRPVRANHHLAPGFHVSDGDGTVSCTPAQPSIVAVDDGIRYCSPDAANAVACFTANTPHHVLCQENGTSRRLDRLTVSGAIPDVRRPRHPEPLEIKLTDGTRCGLRDGGTGAALRHHPDFAVTYWCTGGRAVWASDGNSHLGVHETTPYWTVRTAPSDGKQARLYTHRVARVWFVGTYAR